MRSSGYRGNPKDGTLMIRAFPYAVTPGDGAITVTSWPREVICSITRRIELVTPLMAGRKLSATIAILIGARDP